MSYQKFVEEYKTRVGDMTLETMVREFIRILNIEESSEAGNLFRPNGITSCRVMDAEKMGILLTEMENRVKETKQ